MNSAIGISQTRYSVSPEGIGLSSLTGAKNDIKNKTSGMSSDITVLLGNGTYVLNAPLVFDESDGGEQNFKVIYKAAPGAKPIISGGVKLRGWQKDSVETNIYRTKISGIEHVRNIYVNGRRAKRARGSVKTGVSLYSENGLKEGILFNKTDIEQYGNPSNLEINYLDRWRDFYFLVKSIEDGAKIADVPDDQYLVRIKNFNWYYTMAYPVISPGNGGPMDQFYFENAYELLNEPGEWYFDSATDFLYYYPVLGEDMETVDVVIPKLEQLIKIKSSSGKDLVKNLYFEGLEFAHNSWTWPSINGFGTIQGSAVISDNNASAGDVTQDQRKIKLPGAIQIEDAKNITFKSNIFTHIGSSGIDIKNNSDSLNIERNTFFDISASAISVASWEHRTIDTPNEGPISNTLIKNNYIGNIGVEFASSSAIEGFYTSNMIVDHNELYNMPYSGISIGWGWHRSLSALANNSVTNNKITGVVQKCHDGGGVYTLSAFDGRGMLIEGNFIDELSLPPRTNNEGVIYADEESSNLNIKNNVVKSSRKWFFYNAPGTVSVDSMYVSSSTSNWGGNKGSNTNVTLNTNNVWDLPNLTADQIQKNAGIQDGEEPPYIPVKNVNIALNKPVLSSSYYDSGSISSNANDNSITSFWHSGAKDKPWFYVDLEDEYVISSIQLVTRQTGISYLEARRNFVIEVSNSLDFPASETKILFVQDSVPLADRQVLDLEYTGLDPFRYVRVRKTVLGEHMLISEIRVFGEKKKTPDCSTLIAEVTKDQEVYLGYEDSNCTNLKLLHVTGGSGEYSYLWDTGETTSEIRVCPIENTTYSVEVTDTFGCKTTQEITVEVKDIRCEGGNSNNSKVELCYKSKTKCSSVNAVPTLLSLGATLGPCIGNEIEEIIENILVSPNPTRDTFILKVTAARKANLNIAIYNIFGYMVMRDKVEMKEGINEFQLDLGKYPQGVYITKIECQGFKSRSLKIIKI
ncbi:galactose-binding domain-containing protein [Arenibacter nanhaiticus]|nr:T9SS type A sorting domain-containing protein [Arenibacter nanhaiticus]